MQFQRPNKEGMNTNSPQKKIRNAIIGSLLLICVYFMRPLFHGLIMFFYTNPMITACLFALIGSIIYIIVKAQAEQNPTVIYRNTGRIFFGIIIFIIIIVFGKPLLLAMTQKVIVTETPYTRMQIMPETSEIRVLPRDVAHRYMVDSLQKSKEKIGTVEILTMNGSMVWGAPRVPDGKILYYTQKNSGMMTTKATELRKDIMLYDQVFQKGDEMGFFDNIHWNLYKEKYFMTPTEINYVYDDENQEFKMVIPFIRYAFSFPVMVPKLGGVFVVDSDGTIQTYTPAQAEALPLLNDTWIYPASLARVTVESYKYRLGVMNAFFYHEDEIEITDSNDTMNKQPYLMRTKEGLKWIIAAEPYGESYGIFKMFFIDARTGDVELYELDEESSLTGPVRAIDYVEQKFPTIDWFSTTVVEPRPYVIRGELYWMLSITPRDYAGVTYTVLLNAKTNEMHAFETKDAIEEFIYGEIKSDETTDFDMSKDEKILEKIKKLEEDLRELKELVYHQEE